MIWKFRNYIIKLFSEYSNVWIFSSWYGMKQSDNPKYFFNYVQDNYSNVKLIWITKDRRKINNNNVFYYLGFKGILYQIFAKVVICTHSLFSDFSPVFILLNRGLKVQFWHGAPLKKIMYDVEVGKLTSIKRKIYDRYDLLLSPSVEFTNVLSRAFRISHEKILMSGYPRIHFNEKITSNKKNILYAPTFRDGKQFEFLDNFDFKKLDSFFEEHNYQFFIRLHPRDKISNTISKLVDSSRNIFIDNNDDLYEELSTYDVLVADYSSVIFDFLSFGKPIIFAPFDLLEYQDKLRGTYFSYDKISIEPYLSNWAELSCFLLKIDEGDYDWRRLNILKNKYSQSLNVNTNELIFERISNLSKSS